MKKNLIKLIAGLFTIVLFAFATKTLNQQPQPWVVPAADAAKINPALADDASKTKGKELYKQHCLSCHGTTGKGDGPKAAQLDTESGDFTSATFKKETDGTMYYQIKKGRKDMPSYATKIPADDIWDVVNYIKGMH
ncbi:MAG: cytochrome c [Ferruginibacter sp.]